MADFISNFVLNFRNNTSAGLNSVTKEINQQKAAIDQLKRSETIRSLEARKESNDRILSLRKEQLEILKNKQLRAETRYRTEPTNPKNEQALKQANLQVLRGENAIATAKNQQLSIAKRLEIQQKNNALSLLKQGEAVKSVNSGLLSSITSANLLSSAITGGIGLAIQGIVAAIGMLSNQFQDALAVSEAIIPNATALTREFGLTRKEASAIVVEQQKSVEALGRDLPVSIKEITEALSLAQNTGFTKLAGGNIEEYNKSVIGNTNDLGVIPLAAILRRQLGAALKDNQFQQGIAAMADPNAKVGTLKRLEFFRLSGLSAELEALNFDDAKDGVSRMRLYVKALKNILPQDAIDEQKNSISAITSSFSDKLFASRTGLFGFLRDLDPNLGGDQTLFDEVRRTVDILVGQGGIFDSIGTLLPSDPMKDLRDSLRAINDMLEGIRQIGNLLTKITASIGGATASLENSIQQSTGVKFNFGQIASNALQSAKNPVAPIIGDLGNLFNLLMGRKTEARYQGNIRTASSGFYPGGFYGALQGAVSTENRNKPPGSSIVIANTSEAILPGGKLSEIINNSYQYGTEQQNNSSLVIENGAITIVVRENESATETADRVLDRIIEKYDRMKRSMYAT